MAEIKKIGKSSAAIHLPNAGTYTVSLSTGEDIWNTRFTNFSNDWESDPIYVMGKKIVPYGANNDLPTIIRDVMDDNNLAPGILESKIGLLYGDGPQLYNTRYENGEIHKEYVHDAEIDNWLKTWNFKRFLEMALVEFSHMKGFFAKIYRNKGGRFQGMGFIKSLEVEPIDSARLGWPEGPIKRLEAVRRIYTGDFANNCLQTGITTYPVFDVNDPYKYPVSMYYYNIYSFARSFYSVPSFFGTLKWLQRSSEIPEIIKHLTENGIAAAFHIRSPKGYWDAKLQRLHEVYPDKPEAFIEKKLEELKDELFASITKALAGKQNAGKFIETVDFYDSPGGELCKWSIEPIDQKIRDFIEAQIKVGEKADSAATSGMNLHPSLSNIIVGGKMNSGSELLYAIKRHVAFETAMPEQTIFQPINDVIAANWPNKKVKLGFYRPLVNKESEVTPTERLVNTV